MYKISKIQTNIAKCFAKIQRKDVAMAYSRDLENCLELAIRKGKAVGETKPTENNGRERCVSVLFFCRGTLTLWHFRFAVKR